MAVMSTNKYPKGHGQSVLVAQFYERMVTQELSHHVTSVQFLMNGFQHHSSGIKCIHKAYNH